MPRLINSALTDRIVRTAGAAMVAAAVIPEAPLDIRPGQTHAAVHAVRKEAHAAIKADPEMQHLTGTEQWFQKRSRWAAIVSGVLVVAAPLLLKYGIEIGPQEQEFITLACTTLGGLAAGWLAYRAGTASKPLSLWS